MRRHNVPPLDFPSFLLGIFMVALIVTLYVLCEDYRD